MRRGKRCWVKPAKVLFLVITRELSRIVAFIQPCELFELLGLMQVCSNVGRTGLIREGARLCPTTLLLQAVVRPIGLTPKRCCSLGSSAGEVLNRNMGLSNPTLVLSGSGKSHLARALRDVEVMNGGSAPRVHTMDEYFVTEVEKEVSASAESPCGRQRVVSSSTFDLVLSSVTLWLPYRATY